MITTIQVNKKDKEKFEGVNDVLKHKIDLIHGQAIKVYALSNEKCLVGIHIPLESWKKINHWVIDSTTENIKYTLRDAITTLLEESI